MATKKSWQEKITNIDSTVQIFLALGLLVITILLSRGAELPSWEQAIFEYIYSWPSFLFVPFWVITQFGSIYILWTLLVVYLFKRHYHKVLRMLMVGTLAYLISGFVKDIWGRARPNELIEGIVNLDYVRGPGFPSGHTALAVALAFTIGHYLPRKYYWLVVVWIAAVGVSRIYLGVHAPLDIVGGFAIGWLAFALFRHVRIYDVAGGKSKKKKLVVIKKP